LLRLATAAPVARAVCHVFEAAGSCTTVVTSRPRATWLATPQSWSRRRTSHPRIRSSGGRSRRRTIDQDPTMLSGQHGLAEADSDPDSSRTSNALSPRASTTRWTPVESLSARRCS